MSLRVRYVVATSAITLVTLGAASIAVTLAVNASQEHQLDLALVREAREEAAEADKLGGDELAISNRPGPFANDVGPLTKYAVIYGSGDRVIAQTPSWQRDPPPLSELPPPDGNCFDLWSAHEHLRAVHVDLPSHDGSSLLLAAPRTDLDGDARFLARTMATGFAVALVWTVLVALAVVHRLTRDHRTIAEVARRVAAGDLDARIDLRHGDREIVQLARDIDAMIERLGLLLGLQKRFVANAAHELRSPLTTLYGELSHALRRSRDASEYERAIREALESTSRLRRLTEDLLAVARMGAIGDEPGEPGDIVELGREAIALVRHESDAKGITIEWDGPGARVVGRAGDLVRLLRNLLENAVRHTPAGGVVRVRSRPGPTRVELNVRDEGPGVPPAEREQIFEAFFRGTRERGANDGGTGLGLTIAREIAHAYGGQVIVAADDGPGAVFSVTLQRAPQDMA
ncbi:HAMP domain-containing sensor histidine kinase [Nannocystis sp. SCPEA4]|uniref:sensor histidine kinase n=1 Tax=Nannocystis sp. SCPEA4 TaxID=2996787 RepID=UPI0022717CCA|nr:HAMP domain-containing sensor histidine kinase [Nannocystis sp. SCPEA4]MCY1056553.1 HAMP domain-containing sensor histidine kinase [Nannocystis sp. SCPEA4]